MRRLLVLLLLPLALAAGAVDPSNPHGTRCVNRIYGGGTRPARTICVEQNTEAPSQEKVEGLVDLDAQPLDRYEVKVEVAWIRLWRCQGHRKCSVVSFVGDSGWLDGTDGYYSTGWYDNCVHGGGDFHTQARYRIMWMSVPSHPIGKWHTQQSHASHERC